MRTVNMIIDAYAAAVTAVLCIMSIMQRRQNRQINNYFIGWMIAHIIMLLLDMVRWYLRGKIHQIGLFSAMFFAEYIVGYICLILFHYYHIDYLKQRVSINKNLRLIVWPISIVMSILWILSYSNRSFYVITYNAVNVQSDIYFLSLLPAILLIVFDLATALFYLKKMDSWNFFNFWLPMSFLIIAFPMILAWDAKALFIGITLALLSRYAMISSEQNKLLVESRIAIAMSQIQPHFLYNALGSISALCDIDPTRARDATDHFAEYLRMNLESMKQITLIPFYTELNHIETYLWLEKMRFGARLQVEFDIQVRDFQIPALSIQPIVENAVKHGVCMKESGGTITISTWDTDRDYFIEVADDGGGFTQSDLFNSDNGKLKIGIENVMNRLKMMVDGDIEIQSIPEEGTVVRIRIPKE